MTPTKLTWWHFREQWSKSGRRSGQQQYVGLNGNVGKNKSSNRQTTLRLYVRPTEVFLQIIFWSWLITHSYHLWVLHLRPDPPLNVSFQVRCHLFTLSHFNDYVSCNSISAFNSQFEYSRKEVHRNHVPCTWIFSRFPFLYSIYRASRDDGSWVSDRSWWVHDLDPWNLWSVIHFLQTHRRPFMVHSTS